MKPCRGGCGETDPAAFGSDKGRPSGRAIYCRACMAARTRAYRIAHPEQRDRRGEKEKKKFSPDTVAAAINAAQVRARRKGLPCTIRRDNLPPLPDVCPILGIPLQRGKGRPLDSSPSLDRIVPHLGYVPGNVRWVSHRFNRLRSNMTEAEAEAEAEAILADFRALRGADEGVSQCLDVRQGERQRQCCRCLRGGTVDAPALKAVSLQGSTGSNPVAGTPLPNHLPT